DHPFSRLMFLRSTDSWWRKIAMMIARPTAASAAATVMTNTTNTCPVMPCMVDSATKLRFTALSMSSTHMKMMIAFRRVSTPTTPMVNRIAEKKSDSGSMSGAALGENDGADDGGQEQDARDLEREQILAEQRLGDAVDHTGDFRRHARSARQLLSQQHQQLRHQRESDGACRDLPPFATNVRDLGRMPEIQQHDDEQEHDHDRAGVHEDLNRADELRIEHDVQRGETEQRLHEPQGGGHRTLARDERQRG